jgi:hypothetical protein
MKLTSSAWTNTALLTAMKIISNSSLEKLPRGCLGPDPGIPLVQLLHPRGHGALDTRDFALAGEEAAPEPQLNLFPLLVNGGTDREKAVRRSHSVVTRRVTAADGDSCGCLFNNLKVVGDFSSLIVGALGELLIIPELFLSLGTSPLVLEVLALNSVA